MDYSRKSKKDIVNELRKLKSEIDLLRNISGDNESSSGLIEFNLRERVKELRCHNSISMVLNDPDIEVEEGLQRITDLIPTAWQYPELAQASIRINDRSFRTKDYRKPSLSMSQPVMLSGKEAGAVEVSYHVRKSYFTEPVFLKEENDLLFSVAVLISNYVDRDKRKKALESSEKNHRDFINCMNDTVWVIDFDTRILDVNNTAVNILGYTREELLSMKIQEIDTSLPPEKIHDLAFSMKKDEVQVFETSHRTKAGKHIPVEISSSLVSFGGKTVILSIARDITERKMVEKALMASEDRYYELFNNIKSGVAIYEARDNGNDFIFRDFNRAAEQLDGDLKENILGRSIFEIRPGIEEFGLLEVFRRVYRTGSPEHYPATLYKDKKLQAWYTNYVYKLPSGEIVAVFDNITDLKKAEEALRHEKENFRHSIDDSPLGKRITTIDGDTIYVNKALLDLYGLDNIDEFINTPLRKRYTHESYLQAGERKLRRRAGDFSDTDYEVNIVRKDGKVRNLRVWRKEILWDGEKQFQVIYDDITEHKQAEEELRRSGEALENLNRRLNEIREEERALISRELHDQLGQSLTALKIDLNKLKNSLRDNPDAVTRLADVVEIVSGTIKDVQRISSDLRPEILYDLGLVSAIEWYTENFEKRTGIKCHLKTDFNNYAGSQKNLALFRILQESLTNVIRHAQASYVNISLKQSESGTVMNIRDNGTGISDKKLTSSASLGIIGMQERARQFGGKVEIKSGRNQGTTVRIIIP